MQSIRTSCAGRRLKKSGNDDDYSVRRRRRKRPVADNKSSSKFSAVQSPSAWLLHVVLLSIYHSSTLSSATVQAYSIVHNQQRPFTKTTPATPHQKQQHSFPRRGVYFDSSSSSSTALSMVLTTPESIIEQASTQKLLDDLIDESVRTSARRPIMMQFDPSSGWIWKRWKGTIFSETGSACISKMAYAVILLLACRFIGAPLRLEQHLSGFNVLWGQMLQVTTFTLTFFLNQSYALWRKCYALSRKLQGRMHDINLAMAMHATRKQPTSDTEPSTCTAASRQILELVARYVRLFNLLTYASFTRSHRPILTPRGMRRLVERGLLTPLEREILVDCELPATVSEIQNPISLCDSIFHPFIHSLTFFPALFLYDIATSQCHLTLDRSYICRRQGGGAFSRKCRL